VTLHLPSLRARSDRGLLVRELLTELSGERGTPRASWAVPRIDAGALAEIARRPWPGNVRQLKMALHHALVAAREDAGTHGVIEIRAEHLPPDEVRVAHTAPKAPSDEASLASSSSPGSPAGFPAPTSPTSRREAEELALQRALERAGGNMARAARELGVARSTLYRMLRRHGLASRIGE
jgi:transcriptional regulator of acetoin/glycerol metabolism